MKRANGLAVLSAGFALLFAVPATCFTAAEDAIGTWTDTETGATT
jgi:hypothetical protein